MSDKFMDRLEARFDGWLTEFENRPIRTGLVVIITILLLRWLWRSFK